MDDAEQFLPLYLRFVKGVLDSADLPLNVSRELLQADSEVEAMRGALTRRVLEMLAQAREGRGRRNTRRSGANSARCSRRAWPKTTAIATRSCRCCASQHPRAGEQETVVAGRLCRRACRPARTRSTSWSARISPPRAATRPSRRCTARNVEVLLLGRRIDAWVMDHLQDFEGKKFKDATRGDLELGSLASAADKEKAEAQLKESKTLLKRIKEALGERVSEVRVSTRLKDSAAVLVAGEHDLSAPLRRALEAAGQAPPPSQAGAGAQRRSPPGEISREAQQPGRVRRARAGDLRAGHRWPRARS